MSPQQITQVHTAPGSLLIHLSARTIRVTFGKHVQTIITWMSGWTEKASVLVIEEDRWQSWWQYFRGMEVRSKEEGKGGIKTEGKKC